MAKKARSSKKKASSKKKTKDSTESVNNSSSTDTLISSAHRSPAGGPSLAARGLELARKGSQKHEGAGTEALTDHDMPEDQSTGPIEEAAVTRAKKAILETHERLHAQEASIPRAIQEKIQEKIQVPTKLEICSCEMGYGVFATTKIDDGETIEEAPIIITPIRTKDAQVQSKISNLLPLVIPLQCNCTECEELGFRIVLSSGYIQIYNHSVEPNARVLQHKANKRIYVVEALKSIDHGEQIFINYGPNYPEQWLRPPGIMKNDEK